MLRGEVAMQLVAMPGSRRSLASGHEVAEIPMLHPNLQIRMHTIAAGTGGVWAGCPVPTLLVVLEGIGKVTIDGSAQRLMGPCAVSVPPIAAVQIANQGAMQMRVLEVSSHRHEDVSEANALWNRPRQS
jgi:hypothetical protein